MKASQASRCACQLARLTADLGFDCLWSAEHHFNDYSFVPDNIRPPVLTQIPSRRSKLFTGLQVSLVTL
jgi:alkanesulfonate monooxygenase SsuD/methylene tetrahydromethanopterin reductase-like flavin-dependent oxidoreductase (luciferase family)